MPSGRLLSTMPVSRPTRQAWRAVPDSVEAIAPGPWSVVAAGGALAAIAVGLEPAPTALPRKLAARMAA